MINSCYTIAWITYGSFTRNEKGEQCVNRSVGLFADIIADKNISIRLAMAEADLDSSLYQDKKSVYTYKFRNKCVLIFPLTKSGQSLKSRIVSIVSNIASIWQIVNNCNTVHINLPSCTGLGAAWICMFRNIPFSIYVGSDWNETGLSRFEAFPLLGRIIFPLYFILERLVVCRSVFCLCAGSALAARYSTLNAKTYETVPMVQFNSNKYSTELQRSNNIIRLLCVGNIRPEKGTDILIKAAGELQSRGRTLRLTLVGSVQKTYQIKLESLASKYGLDEFISYCGYISDEILLRQYYANADIFVLPTYGEGFPRVLYEAMLSCVPIVASDIPSIRNNLNSCEAALLTPPGDAKAMADAIIRIADDSMLRSHLIEQGLNYANIKISGNAGEQYLALLKIHKLGNDH